MSDILSVHIKKIINYTGWPEGFTHVALQGGSTDNANLYFFTGKPETETYEYRGYRCWRQGLRWVGPNKLCHEEQFKGHDRCFARSYTKEEIEAVVIPPKIKKENFFTRLFGK